MIWFLRLSYFWALQLMTKIVLVCCVKLIYFSLLLNFLKVCINVDTYSKIRDTQFLLYDIILAKQEDDEMVLQIIYVFYQIAKHDSTRDYLIRETGNGNNEFLQLLNLLKTYKIIQQ